MLDKIQDLGTVPRQLCMAGSDVLAAAAFLEGRGVKPPEGWIRSQITTLSIIYRAARSPEQAVHLIEKFCKPLECDATDLQKLLSIGIEA